MIEDLRLNQDKLHVPRRDDYEKRPVLSATIHPDIKTIKTSHLYTKTLKLSSPSDD